MGFLLGGPVAAAAGYLFGVSFGTTGIGTTAAQLAGLALSEVISAIDPLIDITTIVACVLCGPSCIICVLAAEVGRR